MWHEWLLDLLHSIKKREVKGLASYLTDFERPKKNIWSVSLVNGQLCGYWLNIHKMNEIWDLKEGNERMLKNGIKFTLCAKASSKVLLYCEMCLLINNILCMAMYLLGSLMKKKKWNCFNGKSLQLVSKIAS